MTKNKPKPKKLSVDFGDIGQSASPAAHAQLRRFDSNENRRPGRPIGKRSNPSFRQYTVLIRIDTRDRAIEKLRRVTAKPDFGEYVESLILKALGK